MGLDNDLGLSPSEAMALEELRRRLVQDFSVEALIVFGSAARGERGEESDLDLLVITPRPLNRVSRHEITDLAWEINFRFGTNFSTLVVDRESWETGIASALPIRDEIMTEGVRV